MIHWETQEIVRDTVFMICMKWLNKWFTLEYQIFCDVDIISAIFYRK